MSEPSNEYLDDQKASIIKKIHAMEKEMPAFMHDFFTYYLAVKEAQPRTVLNYGYDLEVFFYFLTRENPSITDVKAITSDTLGHLEMQDIQEYMAFLESYEKDGKIYQNSTAGKARKLASLKSLYKYLKSIKAVTDNPTELIPTPKQKKKNIIMMEHSEASDFMDNVENGDTLTSRQREYADKTKERDIAIVTLLLHTGIRISELVGLDLFDVNMKDKTIRIVRKGGAEDYAYFDEETKFSLESYINNERSEQAGTPALFISMKGNRMSVRAVERMVKKYAVVIPNKKITPHKLRSSFATALYRESGDIYLVKEALGHKSIAATSKYADVGSEKKKKASEIISKVMI